MKKIFLILGIIVLVLITCAVVVGFIYIGPIIKIGMEQIGPKVAQVPVKVDTVDVSIVTGSAAIKGLVVGNPAGYTSQQAISVGTVAIKMDPMSAASSKILIHSVHVESPEITFEGGLSNNNLTKILNNVTSFTKNINSANGSSVTAAPAENKPAPKIEVDDFLITGAKVHINISEVVTKDISLPDIHLTDLGKGGDGLTPADLTKAVLSAITSNTIKTVTSSVINLGQGVKGLGTSAVKTLGESVSKITGSFGGFLGK
jgi:hypothetical protein